MHTFFLISLYALCAVIPFFLYRIAAGPDVFDRLIGLNGISTKAVLLLVFIGVYTRQLDMFIDICIGFTLLNLVGAVAVGKYLEKKGLKE